MYFKAVLVILSVLFIISCGTEERGGEVKIPEMEFSVNDEMLGAGIRDSVYNVLFSPPIRWEPLQDNLFNDASRRLTDHSSEEDSITITPVYIFLDMDQGSSLIISDVQVLTAFGTENIKRYETSLKERFGIDGLQSTEFLKDGIHFHQYLLQKEDTINFKLVMHESESRLLQWDYIVPRNVYAVEVRAIESSIGSIRRIH